MFKCIIYIQYIYINLLFMSTVLTNTPENYETGKNIMQQKKKSRKSKININSHIRLFFIRQT